MTAKTILLVEDNADDVFLMQRALQKANLNFPIQIVEDGEQAVDYLGGHGKYSNRTEFPLPAIVFLDLKLPYMHGFEVLLWIRQHASLKDLPVVVLTSSPEERDRARAQELGAKAYLVKPPSKEMVLQATQILAEEPAAV